MKYFTTVAILCLSVASAANSQEFESVGMYETTLSSLDMRNSSGARLGNFCAVVQQDRANWHRFGKRDAGDQGDKFFNTPAMRALIGSDCEVAKNSGSLVNDVLSGIPRRVGVDIHGWGTRVDYVFIWALD